MTESKLLRALQSRKLWMAAIGLILILVSAWGQDPYPTDAVVTAIMGVVAAFIAATAWEDGKQAEAQAKPTTTIETPASTVTLSASDDTPPQPMAGGRMGM